MGFGGDRMCVSMGLLALAHAAYSAAQHRAYLRLTEQPFSALPADILLQSLAALVLTCYGLVRAAGIFRDIMAAGAAAAGATPAEKDKKVWENVSNRPAFYTFNHRGKALFNDRD